MSHRYLIISAVYPPEPFISAQNSRDLACELVRVGAQVVVLAPVPSRPIGVNYSDFLDETAPRAIAEDGVEVVRLGSYTSPSSRLLSRMRESWSFGAHVWRYLRSVDVKPDVIYMNAWPLLSQLFIAIYCKKRKVPLVMQVMDVYPESLLKKLPQGVRWLFQWSLLRLDRWLASQSSRVVVISDSVRSYYELSRRLPYGKVAVVHTWLDDDPFRSMPCRVEAAVHYDVSHDLLTFVFLGNIGPVAGVELLIEAYCSADISGSQLLVIGDGSSKVKCMELAERRDAKKRVHFISDPEASNVPKLLSLADICLLPMRAGTGASSLPSKIMAYMFARKPILASVDDGCDTANCIREAGCGWVVPPDDVEALALGLRRAANVDELTLKKIGSASANYGRAKFAKSIGVTRMKAVLQSALA